NVFLAVGPDFPPLEIPSLGLLIKVKVGGAQAVIQKEYGHQYETIKHSAGDNGNPMGVVPGGGRFNAIPTSLHGDHSHKTGDEQVTADQEPNDENSIVAQKDIGEFFEVLSQEIKINGKDVPEIPVHPQFNVLFRHAFFGLKDLDIQYNKGHSIRGSPR